MPKSTTVQPPDLEHLSLDAYMKIWDGYFVMAMGACLAFHGGHPSSESGGPDYCARVADQMMAQRNARLTAAAEQALADKEATKTARKTSSRQ